MLARAAPVDLPASFLQSLLALQLVGDGQEINGFTAFLNRQDSVPYPAVLYQKKVFRSEKRGHIQQRVRVDQNGPQNCLFGLDVARGNSIRRQARGRIGFTQLYFLVLLQ